MYFESEMNGKKYNIDVIENKQYWKISIQEHGKEWEFIEISKTDFKKAEAYFSFLFKGSSYLIDVVGSDTDYTVFTRGSYRALKIYNDEMLLHRSLKNSGSMSHERELKAGMPGKIIEIFVKPGDVVKYNKPILIMEAMKMENEMRASADCVVKEICVKQGDSVDSGSVLIRFE